MRSTAPLPRRRAVPGRVACATAVLPGLLTMAARVLVECEAAQASPLRREDYTQTAAGPVDDCTIRYAGDRLRRGATARSKRIGAFRLPGCR